MHKKTGVGLLTMVILICTALPAAAQPVEPKRKWMCAIDFKPPFPDKLDGTEFYPDPPNSELTCTPSGEMHIRCNGTLPPAIRATLGFKNTKTYKGFPCRILGSLCGFTDQFAGNSHLTVNGKTGVLKLHCNTAGPN